MKLSALPFLILLSLFACKSGEESAPEDKALGEGVEQADSEQPGLRDIYNQARLILESPNANLYRVYLPVGATVPGHEGGRRIVYPLDPAGLRIKTGADEFFAEWQSGRAYALPAGALELQNTLESANQQLLILEQGETPAPSCAQRPTALPAPTNGRLLLDSARVFALEYDLAPGNIASNLPDAPFLFYGLSEGEVNISMGLARGKDRRVMNGFANWYEGCAHRIENVGYDNLSFMVLGFWAEPRALETPVDSLPDGE